jgi:glycerol-3-phosphate dehydrogenase (NAD(P)+)
MMISILGAGAFGSAMAIALARSSNNVTLWCRSSTLSKELQVTGENKKYLAGIKLSEKINVTSDISFACKNANAIMICIPTQQIYTFLNQYHSTFSDTPLILCSKGIDEETSLLQSQVVRQFLPSNEVAVLTGPSFANELAMGLPIALTLACKTENVREYLQKLISTPSLRLYSTSDIVGAQIGGSLKNVIAIGCGMVRGASLGESAQAGLMTRGFSEIVRLGIAMGSNPKTFYGLSGLGDLALTCNSLQSRNFVMGLNYGKNIKNNTGKTVEGIKTASAANKIAIKLGVEAPIIKTIDLILKNKISLNTSIKDLLSRPLKQEFL